MSLEPLVFPRVVQPPEAAPNAQVQIIETIGIEVVEVVEVVELVEDTSGVAPANLDESVTPHLEGPKPVPFASTLRHIA